MRPRLTQGRLPPRSLIRSAVSLSVALGLLVGSPQPSSAAALFGWRVVDVPPGDLLNVRIRPNESSPVLVGYPERTPLSLTGRCTGKVRLDAISGLPPDKQQQVVRSRWCEVWVDPTGNGAWRSGWVRGRYIRPQ
jgi:hypothetical protein